MTGVNLHGEKRPNIVFILTDDQGWGDLTINGNSNLSTPNIDQLARTGAILEHFYVQPVCAPTRAEILTGRYYPRTGVSGVTQRAEYLNLDEATIGDVFKAGGYTTGYFGKWHSGSPYPYHPNGRGFDEFYGFCCGHWSHYFDSTLEHNGKETRGKGYIIDNLTEKAMEFIDLNSKQPFFCFVAFNTPHSPFQIPDLWYDKFRDSEIVMRHYDQEKEDLDVTRTVLAMCENIDWNVGRLVNKIAEKKLAEDTILVYLSDNGPNSWRWNGNMTGKKGSTDEGGVRSACFFSWPGQIDSGIRIEEIAGAIDLLPTLAEFAGIPIKGSKPLDGISLKPLLSGQFENWPERALFSHINWNGGITGIRTQHYRALGNSGGLYDMRTDIGQKVDLSGQKPEFYGQLVQKVNEWSCDVIPEANQDRLIPVGFTRFPYTCLNAQDGLPTGKITWSSIHPNASYFVDWVNIEDYMSWGIDVQTPAYYLVTIMYSCSVEDTGSEIVVSFNDSNVSVIIDQPFDTPLKDGCDRVKRVEAYEKEFKPLDMGTIYLEKGTGQLRLSAKSKTGDEVCQVRAIRLTLTGV